MESIELNITTPLSTAQNNDLRKFFSGIMLATTPYIFGKSAGYSASASAESLFTGVCNDIHDSGLGNSLAVQQYVAQIKNSRLGSNIARYAEGAVPNSRYVEFAGWDAATAHSDMNSVSLGLVVERGNTYTEIEPYGKGLVTGSVSNLDNELGINNYSGGVHIIYGESSAKNISTQGGVTVFDVASSVSSSQASREALLSKINDDVGTILGELVTGTHEAAASTLEKIFDELPTYDLTAIDKAMPFMARAHGGVLAAIPETAIAFHEFAIGNTQAGETDLSEAIGGAIGGALLPFAAHEGFGVSSPAALTALSVIGYGVGSYFGYLGSNYSQALHSFLSNISNVANQDVTQLVK
ncbi:hypothetical protein LDB30_06350 [Acidithiobacillus ferrooxidans]|nr:hypothetical protein LDB30_06350 [Acidithiobacillus ferrooxidans]